SAPSIKNQAPAPTPTAAYRLCRASQSHPAKSKFRNITTSSNGYPQTLRAKAFTRPPSSRFFVFTPPPVHGPRHTTQPPNAPPRDPPLHCLEPDALCAARFSPPPSSYTRAHHTKASRHPVLHHGSWPHPRKGPIISLRDYSHAVVPKRVHGCTAYPYPVSQSLQAHSSSSYGIGMHQVVCTCLCAWCIRTS
ncbi:uncharacterized protein CCOS01_16706, partial [Colletotrichum costaricense]